MLKLHRKEMLDRVGHGASFESSGHVELRQRPFAVYRHAAVVVDGDSPGHSVTGAPGQPHGEAALQQVRAWRPKAASRRRRLGRIRSRVQPSEEGFMRVSLTVAQFPITWDIKRNLELISEVLAEARPDDIVVLPEGALSGYGADLSALGNLDTLALAHATDRVADLAQQKAVHLFCGTLHFDQGVWSNAAVYFSPNGTRWIYRKVNLAMNERGRLEAGTDLSTLSVPMADGPLSLGVQICREIRFPEQWQYLASSGAQAFIYLTHAANTAEPAGVWRSHLISRAAENQRFVLAANVADPHQHCPSMIISPRGEVIAEVTSGNTAVIRTTVDLDQSANWYLDQRRQNLLRLSYERQAIST
ncbi:carbon-nitrogen hydrolase family protein [Streptomyces sp. NPDC039016]|uniref:carbon-nitrogen hydrolase family protein n=1 Tax=Streptomyces sp. NPDC039016 TaxID=3154330 RepID=UPI0034119947